MPCLFAVQMSIGGLHTPYKIWASISSSCETGLRPQLAHRMHGQSGFVGQNDLSHFPKRFRARGFVQHHLRASVLHGHVRAILIATWEEALKPSNLLQSVGLA